MKCLGKGATACSSQLLQYWLDLIEGAYPFYPTECGCDPTGSVSGVCNAETGQCDCRPNVHGRTCSACIENHFGLTNGSGCSPCDCHPEGSITPQCDATTGNCSCQPLVTGRTCSECATGAYGLTSGGCTGKWLRSDAILLELNCVPIQNCIVSLTEYSVHSSVVDAGCLLPCPSACDCDPIGSTSPNCSSPNGQCDCRPGFVGLKCAQCAESFFVEEGQCEG